MPTVNVPIPQFDWDQYFNRQGATYNTGTITRNSATAQVLAYKSNNGSSHTIYTIILLFNTGDYLPDDAVVSSAFLTAYQDGWANDSGRFVVGDYFSYTGTDADYNPTPAGNALSFDLNAVGSGDGWKTVALFNVGSISTTANTHLNIGLSGGAVPVGDFNTWRIRASEFSSAAYTPYLTINYTTNIAPTANFSVSGTGMTRTFTDTSTDPDGTIAQSWWRLGDGSADYQSTVPFAHTFASGGTYTVQHWVYDNSGALSNTATQNVVIPFIPTADFTYNNATPLSVTFTDTSTVPGPATIASRIWYFDDATQSTTSPVTHNYASPDTYNVQLEVTASNGQVNSVTKAVPVLSSLQVSGATASEGTANRLITLPRQAATPLTGEVSTRASALVLPGSTANSGTVDKLVSRSIQASTATTGTLSTVLYLPENRQGLAVRRDAQGRLYVNPDYLTGARRDAQGRAFIDPDATNSVARVDVDGRGFIQYNFYGDVSTASTSQDVSTTKLAQLNASSSTASEVQAPKLVSPAALAAATSCEVAFFDAFRASIMIMVGETLCEVSAQRLINKIADAGTACEASAEKLVTKIASAATAAVGSAIKLVANNSTAETANSATATKVVQLKPLASTACVGNTLKLVNKGIILALTAATGTLLGGVQEIKTLAFTLGSYLAGKRGSIEPRVNLFLSNIVGDEIEPILTGESMSVNLANGRDHTWELAVRMAHSDVFDPLTDIVKPTLDYWNGESWDRFPMGLYRMSHPNEENLEHIKFWNLKGRSLESLLAEDMAPGSYSVPKNAGVLLEVKTILRAVFDVPDEAINFPAQNEEVLLASPMFFDVATATEQCYWLPICNSLLAAAGFTPLQTDARGRFYTRKYQDPNIRQPDIRYGMGGDEIINAESAINIDRDASEFANRVIVISNDTTVAPIAAIAANHNPQSLYSIENYKKTVTKTVTLQNVVSNAEARLMAQVELARRSGIFEKLAFQTAPDPRRGPGEVLEVYIEDENGDPVISGLWMYEGWSMNLEPLSLQDHTASRITTTA